MFITPLGKDLVITFDFLRVQFYLILNLGEKEWQKETRMRHCLFL